VVSGGAARAVEDPSPSKAIAATKILRILLALVGTSAQGGRQFRCHQLEEKRLRPEASETTQDIATNVV
jgi:hypothetical protein